MADRALARALDDVKDSSVRVAEIRLNDSERLFGIMEDISRCLKNLETAGTRKNNGYTHFLHCHISVIVILLVLWPPFLLLLHVIDHL